MSVTATFPFFVFKDWRDKRMERFIFSEFESEFKNMMQGITEAKEYVKRVKDFVSREGTEESEIWVNDLKNKDIQQLTLDTWNELVQSCDIHRLKHRWINAFRRVCELESEKKYSRFQVSFFTSHDYAVQKEHYWFKHLKDVNKELHALWPLCNRYQKDYFMVLECHLDEVLKNITEEESYPSSRMGKLLEMFQSFDPVKLPGPACAGESNL